MSIRYKLIILNFLEFFIWGSWLLSIGTYMSNGLHFTGVQIGSVFAGMGVVSFFMPAIAGVIADKWIRASRLFSIALLISSFLFVLLIHTQNFETFYWFMFLIFLFYMPTLALNNSISFHILEQNNMNPVKHFPSIRVWGTVGFILGSWCVDLLGLKTSSEQFYIAIVSSIILALYSLTLPKIERLSKENQSWKQRLGIDAFVLFKNRNFAIFLVFSALVGAMLQTTNMWGVLFLDDFKPTHPDSFVVKHSVLLMSLSQIAEIIFIIAIPIFLGRFGIKKVVLMSMVAWGLRFLFFALGGPEDMGLVFLILSMIVYGMAFDFFFISGSLYVDNMAHSGIRSSAQGLFMMMTSGFGWLLGGYGSGLVIDFMTQNDMKDWYSIWLLFAFYALTISIAFVFMFKHKHIKS